MYKDLATTDGTMNTQFMEGTPVLDVAGEKIGTVSEHGVQDGFLVIHRGLLNREAYIPLEVIQIADPSRVYLSITKDAALNQDWRAASMHSGMTAASTGSVAAGPDTLEGPVHEEELVVGRRGEEIGRGPLPKGGVEEPQRFHRMSERAAGAPTPAARSLCAVGPALAQAAWPQAACAAP